MVDKKALKTKLNWLPTKAWWLILGVFLLGFVLMLFNTKKSTQALVMYLPENTNFYYHWSDKNSFTNIDLSKLPIFDAEQPKKEIEKLKNLLLDGFLGTREIVWFQVSENSDSHYLLRLDKAEKIAKWLADNRPDYNYRFIADDVLLLSPDLWLVNNYDGNKTVSITANNLGQGINIFWSKDNPPLFLSAVTKWLDLDTDLPGIYLNIFVKADGHLDLDLWQMKMRQVINTTSTVAWPNEAILPRGADLLLGFGDHQPAQWQEIVSQYVLQAMLDELPYYRLSAKKINEQILKDNFIYLLNNNWLMLSKEDWQARISDWLPDLQLKEEKNRLPDGTVYTEYLTDQNSQFEELSYQGKDYWRLGDLYGAQIGLYYYLSNNENLMQSTMASSYILEDYVSNCSLPSDAVINDLAQANVLKIKDSAIKQYFQSSNIENMTIYSYENSQKIGFRACF